MKIIIINIYYNWVINLYIEYIFNFIHFLNINYPDVEIELINYNLSIFDNNDIDLDLLVNQYDKILFSGEIDKITEILQKYSHEEKKIYFINIEQMSNESYYKYLRCIPTNIKLIDYSEENIPFFKNIYESYLIPPIYNYENIDKEIKDIDLLSTRNNEYRENTILFLEERTRKRIDTINNCYHNERDDIYRKTKIYINLHCSDNHNTMELIRICNLLAKKVIVITTKTIFVDLLFLKDCIICVNSVEDMIPIINNILEDYDFYYEYYTSKFNYDEYYKYVNQNVKLFITP
jgi:hypothetical protein